MHSKFTRSLLLLAALTLPTSAAFAATTDGLFGGLGEYGFNSETPVNNKQNTHGHGTAGTEFDDGSGGDRYDLNYLGFDVSGGQFQFGAVGGSILTDPHQGETINKNPLYLGDIGINVTSFGNDGFQDPTQNGSFSNQWNYAIRILEIVGNSFTFDVLFAQDAVWEGVDIYGREATNEGHNSDTFRLQNGVAQNSEALTGFISPDTDSSNGNDDYVLEGSFDLGLLSLFNEETGGRIITYLTMSCTNDEAIAIGDIAAVPVPAAFWLFGTALIGFIGMSRRTGV